MQILRNKIQQQTTNFFHWTEYYTHTIHEHDIYLFFYLPNYYYPYYIDLTVFEDAFRYNILYTYTVHGGWIYVHNKSIDPYSIYLLEILSHYAHEINTVTFSDGLIINAYTVYSFKLCSIYITHVYIICYIIRSNVVLSALNTFLCQLEIFSVLIKHLLDVSYSSFFLMINLVSVNKMFHE